MNKNINDYNWYRVFQNSAAQKEAEFKKKLPEKAKEFRTAEILYKTALKNNKTNGTVYSDDGVPYSAVLYARYKEAKNKYSIALNDIKLFHINARYYENKAENARINNTNGIFNKFARRIQDIIDKFPKNENNNLKRIAEGLAKENEDFNKKHPEIAAKFKSQEKPENPKEYYEARAKQEKAAKKYEENKKKLNNENKIRKSLENKYVFNFFLPPEAIKAFKENHKKIVQYEKMVNFENKEARNWEKKAEKIRIQSKKETILKIGQFFQDKFDKTLKGENEVLKRTIKNLKFQKTRNQTAIARSNQPAQEQLPGQTQGQLPTQNIQSINNKVAPKNNKIGKASIVKTQNKIEKTPVIKKQSNNKVAIQNNKIEKAPVLKKQSNSKVAIRNNKIGKTPIVKTQGNNKVRNV